MLVFAGCQSMNCQVSAAGKVPVCALVQASQSHQPGTARPDCSWISSMHAHALLGKMNGTIVQPTVCELLSPLLQAVAMQSKLASNCQKHRHRKAACCRQRLQTGCSVRSMRACVDQTRPQQTQPAPQLPEQQLTALSVASVPCRRLHRTDWCLELAV